MRNIRRRALTSVVSGLVCWAAAGLAAPPPDRALEEDAGRVEEVVAKARELKAEIDRLLLSLPEELRALARARIQADSAPNPPPAAAMTSSLAPKGELASDDARDVESSDVERTNAENRPVVEKPSTNPDGSAPSEEDRPRDAPGVSSADTTIGTGVACAALRLLDTNGDGVLSGADRFWRYLYLRFAAGEERSVFEAGVRQIRLDLRSFATDGGGAGYIDVDDRVRLDVVVKKRRGPETGYLAIDADRLARDQGPRLLAADGAQLEGIQELRTGMAIAFSGAREIFNCR